MDHISKDTFFNGKLHVHQPRQGYRYSVDAVLLANHVAPCSKDIVLDLGTGCGIIPMILAYRHPGVKITGIEIQRDLADLAKKNIEVNEMSDRIDIICKDIKAIRVKNRLNPVDLILSNPPFRKIDSGRINPNSSCAIARHEILITLQDITQTAKRMLRTGGKIALIYSADRLVELICQMRSAGIEPKYLRLIHGNVSQKAKMILIEGLKGGQPGIKIGPPLIIHRTDGRYTEEVSNMFSP